MAPHKYVMTLYFPCKKAIDPYFDNLSVQMVTMRGLFSALPEYMPKLD